MAVNVLKRREIELTKCENCCWKGAEELELDNVSL